VSGKSNVKNSEAWVDTWSANLSMGNGDILHFRALALKPETPGNHIEKIVYLPTEKVKLNRITENYTFNDDHTLSFISFLGSQGKNLGFFDLHHTVNSITIGTPGPSISYKLTEIQNLYYPCHFLSQVNRPYAPPVSYDYELYTTEFDE